MRWLNRAREMAAAPAGVPTEPTKGASVGSVGASPATFSEIRGVDDPDLSGDGPPNFLDEAPAEDADHSSLSGGEPSSAARDRPSDRHTAKVMVFHRRGLRNEDAEALARDVASRALDLDDRRICLECRNLQGVRCAVPRLAGAGAVVTPLLRMPQRCPGFEAAT